MSQTKKAERNQFVCRRARRIKLLKIIRVYRLASEHSMHQTETLEEVFSAKRIIIKKRQSFCLTARLWDGRILKTYNVLP